MSKNVSAPVFPDSCPCNIKRIRSDRSPEYQSKLCPVEMVEEKWLKILEGPGTITLGVRFLAEMESWILQVSSPAFLVFVARSVAELESESKEP
jgi:hypothetical protein